MSVDRDWGDFPNTVLRFAGAADPTVDLRKPIVPEQLVPLEQLGLGCAFGIVTGENPMGITQPAERNRDLSARLKRAIEASGIPNIHVDACSPDHSHCERSVAVVAPLESVVKLAYEFDQLAIFWFDGSAFWIVPARSNRERVRLPLYAGLSGSERSGDGG